MYIKNSKIVCFMIKNNTQFHISDHYDYHICTIKNERVQLMVQSN